MAGPASPFGDPRNRRLLIRARGGADDTDGDCGPTNPRSPNDRDGSPRRPGRRTGGSPVRDERRWGRSSPVAIPAVPSQPVTAARPISWNGPEQMPPDAAIPSRPSPRANTSNPPSSNDVQPRRRQQQQEKRRSAVIRLAESRGEVLVCSGNSGWLAVAQLPVRGYARRPFKLAAGQRRIDSLTHFILAAWLNSEHRS
jgi:hypothetical protein